jgi:hypothetical protein
MTSRAYSLIATCGAVLAGSLGLTLLRPAGAIAQGQYPIADQIAAKVVQRYTSSSCEQLLLKKENPAPPSMEEQRALGMLRSDPQMRAAFIGQIAAPIANKMFECGMVP